MPADSPSFDSLSGLGKLMRLCRLSGVGGGAAPRRTRDLDLMRLEDWTLFDAAPVPQDLQSAPTPEEAPPVAPQVSDAEAQ